MTDATLVHELSGTEAKTTAVTGHHLPALNGLRAVAGSVLLDGKVSPWLPPEGDPHAPSDQWIRVRKLDDVHLCPEGSARYADALLSDMTSVFALSPAAGDWSQGSWTSDPDFNNPPGACPDDHPPDG